MQRVADIRVGRSGWLGRRLGRIGEGYRDTRGCEKEKNVHLLMGDEERVG